MNFPAFHYRSFAIYLIASCALLPGALAIFHSASAAAGDNKPVAKAALTVTTILPRAGALPVRLSANGTVAAWQEASIGSELGGVRLTEVRTNVGDRVQAGQVLAVFATESVQADVQLAQAALLEAQANAAESAANADRARAVQGSGALSGQQVNQYLTAEQTARARVASAQATLSQQQLRLKYTQVLSPDSGLISARSATVGSVPGAGIELFRLIRQGRLEWRAEVTAAELPRLRPGMTVSVLAVGGQPVQGRVRMIAPTVDPQTRTALVYVDLPAQGQPAAVKAGMFARGDFELGSSSALTVPQQAVVLRDGFSYVFQLNADQRVTRLQVQVGRRSGEQVEILQGLQANTPVVVQGAGFLNDGDLVAIAPAAGKKP